MADLSPSQQSGRRTSEAIKRTAAAEIAPLLKQNYSMLRAVVGTLPAPPTNPADIAAFDQYLVSLAEEVADGQSDTAKRVLGAMEMGAAGDPEKEKKLAKLKSLGVIREAAAAADQENTGDMFPDFLKGSTIGNAIMGLIKGLFAWISSGFKGGFDGLWTGIKSEVARGKVDNTVADFDANLKARGIDTSKGYGKEILDDFRAEANKKKDRALQGLPEEAPKPIDLSGIGLNSGTPGRGAGAPGGAPAPLTALPPGTTPDVAIKNYVGTLLDEYKPMLEGRPADEKTMALAFMENLKEAASKAAMTTPPPSAEAFAKTTIFEAYKATNIRDKKEATGYDDLLGKLTAGTAQEKQMALLMDGMLKDKLAGAHGNIMILASGKAADAGTGTPPAPAAPTKSREQVRKIVFDQLTNTSSPSNVLKTLEDSIIDGVVQKRKDLDKVPITPATAELVNKAKARMDERIAQRNTPEGRTRLLSFAAALGGGPNQGQRLLLSQEIADATAEAITDPANKGKSKNQLADAISDNIVKRLGEDVFKKRVAELNPGGFNLDRVIEDKTGPRRFAYIAADGARKAMLDTPDNDPNLQLMRTLQNSIIPSTAAESGRIEFKGINFAEVNKYAENLPQILTEDEIRQAIFTAGRNATREGIDTTIDAKRKRIEITKDDDWLPDITINHEVSKETAVRLGMAPNQFQVDYAGDIVGKAVVAELTKKNPDLTKTLPERIRKSVRDALRDGKELLNRENGVIRGTHTWNGGHSTGYQFTDKQFDEMAKLAAEKITDMVNQEHLDLLKMAQATPQIEVRTPDASLTSGVAPRPTPGR